MRIKVGDKVSTKYGDVKVTGIELCESEYEKYGIGVREIFAKLKDQCVFTLDNGHWQYRCFWVWYYHWLVYFGCDSIINDYNMISFDLQSMKCGRSNSPTIDRSYFDYRINFKY